MFAFVLGLAFLLLLLTFRSIVIPIKAIVLNLLSVGAAYGVLVWIFQDGHLRGPARLPLQRRASSPGYRCSSSPCCSGSRWTTTCSSSAASKNSWTAGVPTDEAVERGHPLNRLDRDQRRRCDDRRLRDLRLAATLDIKQLGVGLAVAVLIDATLIRGVLLPATMKLLGDWNWYLPHWLEWMPRVSAEPKPREEIPTAPPRDDTPKARHPYPSPDSGDREALQCKPTHPRIRCDSPASSRRASVAGSG